MFPQTTQSKKECKTMKEAQKKRWKNYGNQLNSSTKEKKYNLENDQKNHQENLANSSLIEFNLQTKVNQQTDNKIAASAIDKNAYNLINQIQLI